MPEVDKSQDWFLIHAREENHKTILKFVRKLDTCDEDDLPITVSVDSSLDFFELFPFFLAILDRVYME